MLGGDNDDEEELDWKTVFNACKMKGAALRARMATAAQSNDHNASKSESSSHSDIEARKERLSAEFRTASEKALVISEKHPEKQPNYTITCQQALNQIQKYTKPLSHLIITSLNKMKRRDRRY